jgi:hypothetical protein
VCINCSVHHIEPPKQEQEEHGLINVLAKGIPETTNGPGR